MFAFTHRRGSVAAVVALVLVFPTFCAAQDAPLLGKLFQDHAVIQRGAPLRVGGAATPGATVTVEIAGEARTAEAGAGGRWSVQLPPLGTEGNPYTLVARSTGGRSERIRDVQVGDVFLCSGQSNMELPVSRSLNAPAEVRGAGDDGIRMIDIGHASSAAPRDTLPQVSAWEKAGPETVADWSAACYYFARTLREEAVDVPIGLVNSSWGGSKISAWMSQDALAGLSAYDDELSLLRRYADDPQAAQQAFGEEWEAWWRRTAGEAEGPAPWQPSAGNKWPQAPAGLGDWKTWDDPALQSHNGMLWLRATADLTAEQAESGATLRLAGVDEVDQTWINGEVVGNTFGYGAPRAYALPARQLREGENVVVTNVLNTYGAGGFTGDPSGYALVTDGGQQVPLEGWRYRKAQDGLGLPPRTSWESVGGFSTIHNGMLAPLHGYGFKAVLWYQGESDTGAPAGYRRKLDALMGQWRAQFGDALPVLVVQLANYGPRPTAPPDASGWAQVREAQRAATSGDPDAALAVTIDIGTPYDIHPPNKQELGRRLARAARAVVYGEALTPSGPVPVEATRRGDRVAVTFRDVSGALAAYGGAGPTGFALCGDAPKSCRYVDARVAGDRRVVLQTDGGEARATSVRYCWADSPVCTLYDEAGLPAGPFKIEVAGD